MTPGKFLLRFYHTPVNRIRDSLRNGGPWQERRTECGRAAMEAAAARLPVPSVASGAALELHLLTGRRFWYQSAFCLWTLARQTGRPLAPVIYDDGSLAEQYRDSLSRLFPAVRFVAQGETIKRLDALLPVARFPFLRERWLNCTRLIAKPPTAIPVR